MNLILTKSGTILTLKKTDKKIVAPSTRNIKDQNSDSFFICSLFRRAKTLKERKSVRQIIDRGYHAHFKLSTQASQVASQKMKANARASQYAEI